MCYTITHVRVLKIWIAWVLAGKMVDALKYTYWVIPRRIWSHSRKHIECPDLFPMLVRGSYFGGASLSGTEQHDLGTRKQAVALMSQLGACIKP